MSYDFYKLKNHHEFGGLNPFGTGQCLTTLRINLLKIEEKSQSLWNRAMSYDRNRYLLVIHQVRSQSLWNRAMSYDLISFNDGSLKCLNPFGTGQCLTTKI